MGDKTTSILYLAAFSGSFIVLAVIANRREARTSARVSPVSGHSLLLTACRIFNMAGVPPTMGFFTKARLVMGALNRHTPLVVAIVLLRSVLVLVPLVRILLNSADKEGFKFFEAPWTAPIAGLVLALWGLPCMALFSIGVKHKKI